MAGYSVDKKRIPTTEEYLGWIEEFTKLPHRRTGSAEGKKSAEYVKRMFGELGLSDVRIEETESFLCTNDLYELTIEGEEIPCFPINGTFRTSEYGCFSTGEDGLGREVLYLGNGDENDFEGIDAAGKIVICHCPWLPSDEETYENEWAKGKSYKYDPKKAQRKAIGRKADSYSPYKWPYNYCRAMEGGAVGFVGILDDYMEDGIFYNEDYTDVVRSRGFDYQKLPGLWIGKTAWKKLAGLFDEKNGPLRGNFRMQKTYKAVTAKNVVGILPGKSEETILIHSHHDSVFSGAVQDASGMAEVIGLARYYAGVSQQQRGKTLMFAALDGHYTEYEGHKDFLRRRKEEGVNIILDAVIEHIAKEVVLDDDNNAILTGEAELRMMYVTDVNGLWEIAKTALERNNIERTIMIPAKMKNSNFEGNYEFEQDEVVSDAFYPAQSGIPVVSILSPPIYLFHPMDKIDMVAEEWLRPIGIMYAEIINEMLNAK